ncbi:MAG: NfeD family protein [Anaerolineales bacterium]|nr:NfeD family protein [Anaerolineales bacterium]
MSELTWIEIFYWVCAIGGGTLFLLRTIMVMIGIGGDHDISDIGDTGDVPMDIPHDAHADAAGDHADAADVSFKFASLQGLTAFFTIFGLVGLALVQLEWHVLLTFLGASAAGILAVWILGMLFMQMKRLQSEGTLDIQNAIGQTGSVYLTIPEGGSGQVRVPVQGSLHIMDAVSTNKKKISTGEGIRVVGITADNLLVVEKN